MRKRVIPWGVMLAVLIVAAGCGDKTGKEEITTLEAEVEEMNLNDENAGDLSTGTGQRNMADISDASAGEIESADMITEYADGHTADAEDADEAVPDGAGEFVRNMKIGWNLGNTFDASSDQNKEDELAYESDWCGIVTTKEMVDAVRAAGFQTMRIPVSWHNHVTQDGNYTISEAWMNRVQEVVDYAIDNDMYVIINIHHDNSTDYIYPAQEYMEQSKAYVSAVWSQIAERISVFSAGWHANPSIPIWCKV